MGKLTVLEQNNLNQIVEKIDNLYTNVKNNVLELADIIHQANKSKVPLSKAQQVQQVKFKNQVSSNKPTKRTVGRGG